ncbi:MAG: hypothetical protein JWN23_3045 [Rhodocyclales bacterium]|nr:hypothetical protein [Rhodocyclales bacterium]
MVASWPQRPWAPSRGAVVGDRVDNQDGQTTAQTVRRCQTTQTSQQRTVGYDVAYEYAGQRYTTRMASDPGEWVPISVNVEGAAVTPAPTTTTVVEENPVVVYRHAPVYWGLSLYFDFGYSRHFGHRRW